MLITEKELRYIMPNCRYPDEWARWVNMAIQEHGLADNISRAAGFLGQTAHESNELNQVEERLVYSPQRILQVWPKQFKELQDALPYGRNPERLANKVYANRLGNGPENSGDGFLFRGRGLIQVTGRANYELVGELLDLPSLTQMPDKLKDKRYAAASAAAWFVDKGCDKIADNLTFDRVKPIVTKLTKKINGGKHGLDSRIEFTRKALEILDVDFSL